MGYVVCAREIMRSRSTWESAFDEIVVASGSAGTHAGLLVGFTGANAGVPLTGVNVRRPRAEQEGNVHKLASRRRRSPDLPAPTTRERVVALDEWVGPGYSLPTDEMVEAVRMFARLEGVLLDPVYTGKAAAGLIGLVASQTLQAELEGPVRAHGRRAFAVRLSERAAIDMSAQTKTVGVIGGLGPAATLDFFDRILKRTKAVRDQDHLRLIIDNNTKVPDRNAACKGEGPSPGAAIAASARGLQDAGADFMVMACNARTQLRSGNPGGDFRPLPQHDRRDVEAVAELSAAARRRAGGGCVPCSESLSGWLEEGGRRAGAAARPTRSAPSWS